MLLKYFAYFFWSRVLLYLDLIWSIENILRNEISTFLFGEKNQSPYVDFRIYRYKKHLDETGAFNSIMDPVVIAKYMLQDTHHHVSVFSINRVLSIIRHGFSPSIHYRINAKTSNIKELFLQDCGKSTL